MKKDRTLTRIITTAAVIVIVVGFFFIGCASGPPLKLQLKSCQETAGVEVSCQTFEFTGEASIFPF